MNPTITLNSNCYHSFTIEDAIAGALKAGYKSIELTATKSWTEHVFTDQPIRKLWQVKDALEQAQLIPIALSGHTNIMDPDRISDFIANMRLANFFQTKYVVTSVGEAHMKDSVTISDKAIANRLCELIPYLERFGLILVIENHGKHATGSRIHSIIREVNHPLVKINFDTANGIFYAGKDPVEDLEECVDEVGYIHLKDKIDGQGVWNFPALGKGVVNIPEIFRVLKNAQNLSPISVEIEFTSSGAKDLHEVDQAVVDSMNYLRSIIDFDGGNG